MSGDGIYLVPLPTFKGGEELEEKKRLGFRKTWNLLQIPELASSTDA